MNGLRIPKSHSAYPVTLKVMVWLYMVTMDSGRARWGLTLKRGKRLPHTFPYTALLSGGRPGKALEISRWDTTIREMTEVERIPLYRIARSGIWQDMNKSW